MALSNTRAIAGPFQPGDFTSLVPADKKLSPEWIRSLFERGQPTVYSLARDELKYIGMPVGGICTGQVYLGGDGRLWHWDVMNLAAPAGWSDSRGGHYAKPVMPSSPIEQGFALRVRPGEPEPAAPVVRYLDQRGFTHITFKGQYPIGDVSLADQALGIEVAMEAFSPFVPLDEDASETPAILVTCTVRNTTSHALTVDIAGWLQNPVCAGCLKDKPELLARRNSIRRSDESVTLECTAGPLPEKKKDLNARPEILFENFEQPTYAECMGRWTATGTAFGDGPLEAAKRPSYMGPLNQQGRYTVNTHNTRQGEDVVQADTHVGTLTSREFTIERHYISLRLGGGNHPGRECFNVLIDGAAVRSATGQNSNLMKITNLDVREFAGRKARLQLVDGATGAWGQIGVDDIVFCDEPRDEPFVLEEQPDFGSMALSVFGPGQKTRGVPSIVDDRITPEAVFSAIDQKPGTASSAGPAPIGAVAREIQLTPGESQSVTFVIAWHFVNPNREQLGFLTGIETLKRSYSRRFTSAADVVRQVTHNRATTADLTRRWRDTWYDSTLPHWFLERTFINASIAATQTCYRFDNNRFYGWEGTYCCAGTCTHVWQYAHSLARLFPALERSAREMVDYGLAFNEGGAMNYRAEAHRIVAHDGQCGTILRAYREHQMSADHAFLTRIWPRVKQSIEFLIREDKDRDGVLEGSQYNTLDAAWFGPMAWISSLYVAALRAGEAMSREMGDDAFARVCADLAANGARTIETSLFNGEYFIHKPDAAHPEANNTNNGCHIDQIFGASTARQVGLGPLFDAHKTRSALRSLWKYNFTPDVGPYRDGMKDRIKGGRWYAMPGEGGLLMCTFPKGGDDLATGKGRDAWAAGYFNECMNGFEYQVAAHMIYEGLVQEGLAITRMLHDRYHASRRNPWNEIECSDHYARSMASHGVYLAACGFAYHGPNAEIEFAPRLTPEKFKAAFTAAQGWGSFCQDASPTSHDASITVAHGTLRLRELRLATLADLSAREWHATLDADPLDCAVSAHPRDDDRPGVRLRFSRDVTVRTGQRLRFATA